MSVERVLKRKIKKRTKFYLEKEKGVIKENKLMRLKPYKDFLRDVFAK